MYPTIHGRGQGARLVVGRSRKDLMRIDTSAFSQLQKPAVDPGPAVPGELPIRTFTDVTKGLGLSYEAERDLTRAMEEWMAAPDPVAFRGRVTRGLRSFAPDNYGVRNELWRRCASLYRSTTRPDRRPQSIVIQKAMKRGQLSGAHLKKIEKSDDGWGPMPGIDGGLRRAVAGGYEYRFPPADLAPAPDPALARVFNARAVPQPPELLFCYSGDDEMSKAGPYIGPRGGKWADVAHTISWKEGADSHAKKIEAAIGASYMDDDTSVENWLWADPSDIKEWSFAEADGSSRSAALARQASKVGVTAEKLQEKTDDGEKLGEKYFGGEMGLDEIRAIVGGSDVLFSGGWQVRKRVDGKDYVFRVMSQEKDPEISSGQHVGEDVSDVRQYRSWAHKPGVFAFPAPNDADVLEVSGLDDLAENLSGTRSSEEWLKRWEDVPHVNHALGMDEREISQALRAVGYTWIKFEEPSGTTLGYVGSSPLRGVFVAKDVSKKAREDENEGFDLIESEWSNLSKSLEKSLEKATRHKYIRRVPTGKTHPKYRYIYKHPQRKGLVVDEHLVEGSKFKVEHAGHLGHFEVLEHHEQKGIVKVKHDESGRTAHIHKRDLARMLEAYHAKQGKEMATAVPAEEKAPAPGKLPRVQMADLARGEWEEVVGFESTEAAALELAGSLKKGWDYAAIKQPNGFMVVAKRQRGAEPSPRERHGTLIKVHLRNEKPLSAVYTLMEADDVVASHNPISFNVRKDYPEGVQERQYHESEHEQKKVMRIAQEMEPVFVINNNPDGVNGTPIVDQDGIVLGGNARAMGIQRAYKTVPDSAKKYKNYLMIHARDYGFQAADIRNMKAPVLIRRTKVDKRNKRFESDGEFDQVKYNAHLRLLGRRMNEGLTQGLDPRAEEVALGKNFVNDRMLRTLTDAIKEGQTLDQFLQTESSRDFVKTLWSNGILDDLNAGQYAYSKEAGADKGLLNKEGRTRLERILVGKMIDSPSLLDRMTPTQRQALANSAVHVVVAQQSGWDVVPQLKRAIQIDQSIQKMEKELDAIGEPRLALKNFLSGKQTELPGVSGMVEEVRTDKLLHHLLVIVREKAGTTATPRDFKGFALRAREDAKKNPEFTGAQDMFGGEYAAKREDPANALDIEFGVTPPRKKEKTARRKATAEEKTRLAAEKKERARQLKEMAAGGLFRSMSYELTMIKAGGEPNRLVTRAINHVEFLVDAAVSRSMQAHGEIRVDGAKIVRQVLADINEAIRKDSELAREQGRSPIDARTVRGFVEAFCQMRGKDLLEKSTLTISADGRIGRLVVKARVYR